MRIVKKSVLHLTTQILKATASFHMNEQSLIKQESRYKNFLKEDHPWENNAVVASALRSQ